MNANATAAAFTTAVGTPVVEKKAKKAKAPAAEVTIITGLSYNISAYNGRTCAVVQELPKISGDRYVLVKVDDFAKHGLEEYVAVRPENLTSPSRKAAADKQADNLAKIRAEIVAYLESVNFKKHNAGEWATKGKNCYINVYLDADWPVDYDSINVSVKTIFNLYDLELSCGENDFEVNSLSEFKRYMKDTFQGLAKDVANKDFLEVVRVATALCAPTKKATK